MDDDSNWGCGCLCLIVGAFIIGAIANSVLGLDLKTKSLSSTFNSLLIPSMVKAATIGKTKVAVT